MNRLTACMTAMFMVWTLVSSAHAFTFNKSQNCIHGDGYLPQNNLRIPADAKRLRGLSEGQFNDVIEKVKNVYEPIVRQHGGNLVVRNEWNNAEVNARAHREGNNYIVTMYGGLARHSVMTEDGFALVLCHEIGHHIGGAPHYNVAGGEWASNEGQSDYFATLKCLRKVFAKDDNANIVRNLDVPQVVADKCDNTFSAQNDVAMCKRISMAGLAGSSLFAAMQNRPFPEFDTPDQSVVPQTNDSHPAYQCRLDTYYNGAICPVEDTEEIGQSDPNKGTCNRANNDEFGWRPLCWFKPGSSGGGGGGNGDVANTPMVNGSNQYSSSNPNQVIPIAIDVRNFAGAVGFVLEASKPNRTFSNPNGTTADSVNGLGYKIISGTFGTYRLIPAKELPGWGAYQFRILPLDRNKRVLGKFSNPLTISLQK